MREDDVMARVQVRVPLRWSDVDAYGHVNNAAWLSILEEARIEAFWADPDRDGPATAVLEGGPGAATHTVVAHQEIEYLLPLRYQRSAVLVHLWVARLGGASLDICYEVMAGGDRGGSSDRVALRATTTLVLVDAVSGSPRRMTSAERDAWSRWIDEPLVLGRRQNRTQVPGKKA
jgi:acyl-CoA thioester hydrolase